MPSRAANSSAVSPRVERARGSAARIEQQPCRCRMSRRNRPHERRLLLLALAAVHVGAVLDERSQDVHVARARCRHRRGFACRLGNVGIRAGLEQQPRRRRVAVAAGERQRHDAVVVRRVHVGARFDEEGGHINVLPVNSPMQSGGAVRLARFGVGAACEERADGFAILPPRGVCHLGVGGRSPAPCRQQKCYGRRSSAIPGKTGNHGSSPRFCCRRRRRGSIL